MEKQNSSLSLLEQAWVAANAYDKSTEIAKLGGIVDTANIRTMADWIKNPKNAGFGIDPEKAEDERLMNKYVIPVTVTIPGTNDNAQVEVIIDSKYRDVAVLSRDADGSAANFKIADRIKKSINSKANLLQGQLSPEELAMLKSELEADLPQDMEELANEWTDKERGRGDDDLGPRSRKEVKEKANKVIKEKDPDRDIDEDEMKKKEEEAKEEAAKKDLSEGEVDILETILEGQGLKISDITQVNDVEKAKDLNDKADLDDTRMNPDEEVLVVRVRNKSMDGSPDHMVVIQNNRLIDTRGKDKEIGDFVDRYAGAENGKVRTSDNEAYDDLEFKADDGTVKTTKIYGKPEPSKEESVEFLSKFQALEAEREYKLQEKRQALENETDPEARENILRDIKYIQTGYSNEFKQLTALYGVELEEHEKDLDDRVTQANKDIKTGDDHTNPDDDNNGRDPRENYGGRRPRY